MCGICGILDLRGGLDLESSVQKMADTLVHRGPDDGDVVICRPAQEGICRLGLGHRRLAIIDLSSAGHQPMAGHAGGTVVVLNGEIYNFLEKRAELPEYPYRSRTDTEVILALYEKHGEDFVVHLDGMFALALWDERAGRLLLARDRAGKKPLFYCRGDGFFAFASEIKSLLTLGIMDRTLNDEALPLYLTFGYVPTPDTFFKGVSKLEPGTLAAVDTDGSMRFRTFWEYPLPGELRSTNELSLQEQETSLRDLIRRAVSRRMIADVPLGAFLSGGIDSSIIVGTMCQISKQPVRTFSIGFEEDPAFDETYYARIAAKRFGSNHTEYKVRPNAIDLVEKLVWHHDEPFGDSSAIPTYIVSELAREHVTVALSGDGGDELFAGYERFAAALWTERLPKSILAAGGFLSKLIPAPAHAKSRRRRAKRLFAKSTLPLLDRYLEWNSFFTRSEIRQLVPGFQEIDVSRSFVERFEESSHCSLLKRLLYLNYRTYLLDDLLVKTDRMSMAHGLEVRCPFLDTRLVEWAAALPDSLKIRRGSLKFLLRRAYRDMLPKEILQRGKMGFGVPLGHWMRHELRDFSHDILLGSAAKIRQMLDPEGINTILTEHENLLQDHGQKIWSLLTLEVWLRTVGREGAEKSGKIRVD